MTRDYSNNNIPGGSNGNTSIFVNAQTQRLTQRPTQTPTCRLTSEPTPKPTLYPTNGFPTAPSPPTRKPTRVPTLAPTSRPTPRPSARPSSRPTLQPTAAPTKALTRAPTHPPTCPPACPLTCPPTPEPTKDPTRERISQFVEEGQMFFVREDQIALGRNLSNPIFPSMTNQVNNIVWFCIPAFSPDNNNDGNYNNVVSSSITFKFSVNKFGNIGGYTAAWSGCTDNFGGSYEEYGTDYSIRTNRYNYVGDSSRSSTIQWTLDGLGSTTGLVTSGEGRWTFDTTESIFDIFKEALNGRELTGETCKAI
jgi:hypothetical protein